MPKVSVLVPLYHTDLGQLREMIDSVLASTFRDFELLLLNDSPDNQNIRDVINTYDDPRIVYTENETNLGISASRNRLIDMAKGEYLAVFDHDDICLPDRLQLQVELLDTHPDIGVCSGWIDEIPRGCRHQFPEDNKTIKLKLMDGCFVAHSASMIRKSVLLEHNIRYEANYSPAEDYMLWIRLVGVTMFHNIPRVLIRYRNHEDNTSHRQSDKMQDKDALIKCIARREYPYLCVDQQRKSWIYLFGRIPVIKIKRTIDKKEYFLFGFIPLWTMK